MLWWNDGRRGGSWRPWPDSGPLFERLRHPPGPLRLTYRAAYVRSLGIAPARTFSRTFQGTPMRHRGADVGHFFLAEKADGEEFTGDDEEVLDRVVTMQDLAPLDEFERTRTEFLGLVSHELRAPLLAIKGSEVGRRGRAGAQHVPRRRRPGRRPRRLPGGAAAREGRPLLLQKSPHIRQIRTDTDQ